MKILLVNDDGIDSLGLKILAEQISPLGDIYIFAPEKHQSGMSQALTIRKKIQVKDYGTLYGSQRAFSAKGTPADCTRLALFIYNNIKFDLVISGINRGANLGSDVLHSGTVGAASEAASLGINAVAVSSPYKDFTMAEKYLKNIVKYLIEKKIVSSEYILNINFPSEIFNEPKGVMFSVQGENKYRPAFIRKSFNKYVATYNKYDLKEKENSDVYCYKNGIISITPIFEDRSRKSYSEKFNTLNSEQLNRFLKYGKINGEGDR